MDMKKKGFYRASAAVVLSLSLALTACGKDGGTGTKPEDNGAKPAGTEKNTAPVSLTMYQTGSSLSDEQFDIFVKALAEKMPYVTLKMVRDGTGTKPQDLIAAGTFPDIIYTANPKFRELQNLKLIQNLDSFVKSKNVDLSIFDPQAIDTIRSYDAGKQLVAIPFSQNIGALFYNKDILDKFGLPYPKDGMDWEQTLELARKIARVDGGKQFRGLEVTDARHLGSALSLPWVNPANMTASINTDGWKRVFQLIRDTNNIPNNNVPAEEYGKGDDSFIKFQSVAMLPGWASGTSIKLEDAFKKGTVFNWDIVSLPNFKDSLGTGREYDIQALMLSDTSKHKDQAFDVIQFLTSEYVQSIVTAKGKISAINTPEMQKKYASDLGSFKGKNIAGIFKTKSAKLNPPTEFDAIVISSLGAITKRLVITNDDINTVMREQEEIANKQIEEEKVLLKNSK
ncbi:ABC transporter substrate-binding protein [Paenibacillus ginsengarvi]|uniref:Extracellular solute-binding protein n=1 Tax=Paenibacillus ginsengarvi TaxID=400777 RepID=A0A3B0CGC8_9BACL|nr:extracellular solute-binding protein [Paenibacillus ginsengarvi]RKN84905.1 extracellular solute-binding protein [Paenibacillus ginsengarvi]